MPRQRGELRPLVVDYLHECNETSPCFVDIRTQRNLVRATVAHGCPAHGRDYMDTTSGVRRWCRCLAEELRAIAGRSVYFTLTEGELCVIT